MKKYLPKSLILLTVLLFGVLSSCSIDDNNPPNFSINIMPIESVDMDYEFTLGQTHEIKMTYTIPNDCYEFNDFLYEINGYQRTIAIINTVYDTDDCIEMSESVEVSLDINVTSTDTYIFRFYQGKDNEGNDLYYIVEVPVVE